MATTTARLGLRKPDSLDSVNVSTDINNNLDQLDTYANFASCTSSTRPSVKWDGLSIHETDTNRCYVWNSAPATSGWFELFTPSTSLTQVNVTSSATGSQAYTANVTGDSNKRFQVRADGRLEWGSGSGATDAFLRRTGSNALTTDGTLTIAGATTVSSTTDSTAVNVSGGGTFAKSLSVGGSAALGGSVGALNLKNVTTAPTAAPSSGLLIYSSAGSPVWTNGTFNTYGLEGSQKGAAISSVSNTTTETTVISVVIPANEIVDYGVYRLCAMGNLSTSATASYMSFRTKLNGSTSIGLTSGSTGVTTNASLTNAAWFLDSYFRFINPGASGNLYNQVHLTHKWDGAANNADVLKAFGSNSTGTPVATNSQVTLAVTVQWGAANASNSISFANWWFERIV